MATKRVAVVTGSNTGIGFATVRGLCKQFDGDVFMCSRSMDSGKAAQAELEKEGLHSNLHQLDIDDEQSVTALRDYMKQHYGGIDILINNAAIIFPKSSTLPFKEQVTQMNRTNFWNTLRACDILFPILKPHARVINVTSLLAKMALDHMSEENQRRVFACKTIEDVKSLIQDFEKAVEAGSHIEKGWPDWRYCGYAISKIGVVASSIIQQQHMDQDPREDIIVNAVCPGLVATNMTAELTTIPKKTPDEGADSPLYIAMLPPGCTEPRGKFVSDRKVVEWQ